MMQQVENDGGAAQKTKGIIETLTYHLMEMNVLIAATSLKLSTQAIPSGVFINNHLCSAEVVLQILEKMEGYTNDMEILMDVLKNPKHIHSVDIDELIRKRRRKNYLKLSLVLAPTLLLTAAGLYVYAKRAKWL